MSSKTHLTRATTAVAASCLALALGCMGGGGDPEPGEQSSAAAAASAEAAGAPGSLPNAQVPGAPGRYPGGVCQRALPFDPSIFEHIPIELLDDIIVQRLPRPTALGEDFAVHVRVPPTANRELDASLIRVAGGEGAPIVLFNSDALSRMGQLEKSPGPGFFTAFARTDQLGLEQRKRLEEEAARGPVNETALVFEGRNVVALTNPVPFDLGVLERGGLLGLGRARLIPLSTQANWDEALFITNPAVVTDPGRTYDTCTMQGNSCGPWTFCHLMTEMANTPRTGIPPDIFARQWLEQWMRDYTVNDDTVARRTAMANIIAPWLAASGGARLDLRKAPFRLLAIVNRVDLRETTSGGGGYGGQGGGIPKNGGELRFVFGVMQPDTSGRACRPLPFTVIFEYGVPISGCRGVREWAQRWTALDAMGGFGPLYRATLEGITEDIVRADVEPHNGNGNAINQIRTNEIALQQPWELREFTLTDESFTCGTTIDAPTDGFLRPHTVAQTPDDAAHTPTPNPIVDEYVNEDVVPPASTCATSYRVPPKFDCSDPDPVPFLGANALADLVPGGSPPGAWLANGPFSSDFVCGRHTFSLNTCNGCHTCDTDTRFVHVDPMSGIPAAISRFLTGEIVPDTQFPGVNWAFNDLDRRYQDLYNVAGSLCLPFFPVLPELFVKFDIDPIGPIVIDFGRFEEVFRARTELSQRDLAADPVLDDFAAPEANVVH
jgi:hypothetical protein